MQTEISAFGPKADLDFIRNRDNKMKISQWTMLFLAFMAVRVKADPAIVEVPNFGSVRFEAPALVEKKRSNTPEQFMYMGNAGRFNASVYVENPRCDAAPDHAAAARCLSGKISNLPVLEKNTLSTQCGPKYCAIQYILDVPVQDRVIRQVNVNLVFANKGKWGDVHLSVVNPQPQDLPVFDKFQNSLEYDQ